MKLLWLGLLLLCANMVTAEESNLKQQAKTELPELPKLEVSLIEPNVYQHKSYQQVTNFGLVDSNGLVVIINNKAYIIDTPWSDSDTQKLVLWIKEQGYQPAASISTHSHSDRTAGIKWLNEQSIPTYASKLTNQFLQQEGKVLATHTFDTFKNNEFWLVDKNIEIFYPGGGHTLDNIVVWLPSSKLLYGGCLVRSLASKNLGYTGEASIEQWPTSVDKVLTKYSTVKNVLPGHGDIGDVKLLIHTKKLADTAYQTLLNSTPQSNIDNK